MKIFALLLVVVAAANAASLAKQSEGSRIVGGQDASPGQFPYQVSLRQGGSHFCGGSIINDHWILTAAHCVVSMSGRETVVTGATYLSSGGDQYQVEKALYHSGFNQQNLQNDIAMIKVSSPIQFNSDVQPIQLNTQNIGGGQPLTLSGWGLTQYPGSQLPNTLQYAQLTSITVNECQSHFGQNNQIFNTQICTFTHAGQGACQGDSGGPLVYGGAQAGIVSWGYPCAKGYPDVFTRVSSYVNWIHDAMQ